MGVTRKQNTLIVDEIGTLRRRGFNKKKREPDSAKCRMWIQAALVNTWLCVTQTAVLSWVGCGKDPSGTKFSELRFL